MGKTKVKKSWYKRWWMIVIYILVALCAMAVIFAPDVTSINAVYNGATVENTEVKSSDFSVIEILENGSKQEANPSDISIDKKYVLGTKGTSVKIKVEDKYCDTCTYVTITTDKSYVEANATKVESISCAPSRSYFTEGNNLHDSDVTVTATQYNGQTRILKTSEYNVSNIKKMKYGKTYSATISIPKKYLGSGKKSLKSKIDIKCDSRTLVNLTYRQMVAEDVVTDYIKSQATIPSSVEIDTSDMIFFDTGKNEGVVKGTCTASNYFGVELPYIYYVAVDIVSDSEMVVKSATICQAE